MKEDVSLTERKRLDIVLRRTKFIILGKETKMKEVEDQRIIGGHRYFKALKR